MAITTLTKRKALAEVAQPHASNDSMVLDSPNNSKRRSTPVTSENVENGAFPANVGVLHLLEKTEIGQISSRITLKVSQKARSTPPPKGADADYIEDCVRYMLNVQHNFVPRDYFETVQAASITPRMRVILLDWMAEVVAEYRKTHACFFLAASFLDRYLSRVRVTPRDLQLLGAACLLTASKCEEVEAFKLTELFLATDSSCTEAAIMATELALISVLEYRLAVPTAFDFVSLASDGSSSHTKRLCALLTHVLVYEASLWLNVLPSDIAIAVSGFAGCTFVASSSSFLHEASNASCKTVDRGAIVKTLAASSGFLEFEGVRCCHSPEAFAAFQSLVL